MQCTKGVVRRISILVLSCLFLLGCCCVVAAVIHLQAEILAVHATSQHEYTAVGMETLHGYVDNAGHGAPWTDTMPLVPPGTSLVFVSCAAFSVVKNEIA